VNTTRFSTHDDLWRLASWHRSSAAACRPAGPWPAFIQRLLLRLLSAAPAAARRLRLAPATARGSTKRVALVASPQIVCDLAMFLGEKSQRTQMHTKLFSHLRPNDTLHSTLNSKHGSRLASRRLVASLWCLASCVLAPLVRCAPGLPSEVRSAHLLLHLRCCDCFTAPASAPAAGPRLCAVAVPQRDACRVTRVCVRFLLALLRCAAWCATS